MRARPLRAIAPMAIVALSVFTARASLADHYRVPSGSMEPTVQVGDRIVVSKVAYGLRVPMTDQWLLTFGGPARGDVVVLERPDNHDVIGRGEDSVSGEDATLALGAVLLKRVVATEGELVLVRDGHVLVDGEPVLRDTEAWAHLSSGGGPDFGPARVPSGHVLVLGDNRGNSQDGRYFGFVDARRVIGRAVAVIARDGHLRYEPLQR